LSGSRIPGAQAVVLDEDRAMATKNRKYAPTQLPRFYSLFMQQQIRESPNKESEQLPWERSAINRAQ
jgi:hypothetical protein